jgi:hypothetical protein
MRRNKKSWAEMTPQQRSMVVVGAAIQLALQAAALRDLRRRTAEQVNGPRWAWAAASFVNTIGPVSYFVFGRRRAPAVLEGS